MGRGRETPGSRRLRCCAAGQQQASMGAGAVVRGIACWMYCLGPVIVRDRRDTGVELQATSGLRLLLRPCRLTRSECESDAASYGCWALVSFGSPSLTRWCDLAGLRRFGRAVRRRLWCQAVFVIVLSSNNSKCTNHNPYAATLNTKSKKEYTMRATIEEWTLRGLRIEARRLECVFGQVAGVRAEERIVESIEVRHRVAERDDRQPEASRGTCAAREDPAAGADRATASAGVVGLGRGEAGTAARAYNNDVVPQCKDHPGAAGILPEPSKKGKMNDRVDD